MPKIKSHRGAKKRYKKTASGKFLRASAFKRHILTSKPTRRKRHLRGSTVAAKVDAGRLRKMLPYD